jgi:hypothetical protein
LQDVALLSFEALHVKPNLRSFGPSLVGFDEGLLNAHLGLKVDMVSTW